MALSTQDTIVQAGADLAYANQTQMHPIAFVVLAAAGLFAICGPRRFAILAFLAVLAMIPSAQRIVFFTLDFSFARIMVLAMLFRIFLRSEWRGFRTTLPDYLLLLWALWSVAVYGLQWSSVGAAITRTGFMTEAVGSYFIARLLLPDLSVTRPLIRWTAILGVLSACFFLVERATGRNLFAIFGGVPPVTLIREGRLRCQGPFSHSIMAGVFWASFLPFFIAHWCAFRHDRLLMAGGVVACLLIIVNTASSTPAMALIISLLAMLLYAVRSSTPTLRLLVLLAIPILHLVMDKGVHHLLARINLVGGSTGWHRYHLMDQAMHRVHEWALIGTRSTGHWGWGLQDVTNQYVLEGVRGGLLALVLFGAWLIAIFVALSRSIRRERRDGPRLMLWACGAMMFTHCLGFLAVSYFGQMVSAFYLLSGLSVSLAYAHAPRASRTPRSVSARMNDAQPHSTTCADGMPT